MNNLRFEFKILIICQYSMFTTSILNLQKNKKKLMHNKQRRRSGGRGGG